MAIQYSNPLDRIFHALGDETRRQILARLSNAGKCNAGELGVLFKTAQPTISKHLKVLETAGLIQRHIDGRQHFFTFDDTSLNDAQEWIERHRSIWKNSLGQLGDFLDATEIGAAKNKPDGNDK